MPSHLYVFVLPDTNFPQISDRLSWLFIFIGEGLLACNRGSMYIPWSLERSVYSHHDSSPPTLSQHIPMWGGGRFGVPRSIKGKSTSVYFPSILSQLRQLSSLPSGSPRGILFICWVFRYCIAPWPQLHSLGCLLASFHAFREHFLEFKLLCTFLRKERAL